MVQSTQPALTRWFGADDSQFNALQSYFYNVDAQVSAEYEVAKNSDINFEFRGSKGTAVDILLYDKDIEVERYRVFLQGATSLFDRVIDETTIRLAIFESEQFFVRLPENVNRIVISSPHTVLAKLQARQSAFHYQGEICEHICQPSQENFFTIGAWFSQKALNDFVFTEQKRITNVRLFEMPPELPSKEEMATTYLSRDLIKTLPLSNTFLVNSPDKHFADLYEKMPPTEHQFSQVNTVKALLNAQKNNQVRAKRLIKISRKEPFYKEQPLTNFTDVQLLSIDNEVATLFVNDGEKRPWQKQRSYFLKAGQPLTLNYTNKPESVVIKAFKTTQATEHVILNTRINGKFKPGLSSEYTIVNKRFALLRAHLTQAIALHPAIKHVSTYNSVSLTINNDLETLSSITITAEQDIWISVLDELTHAPSEIQWRQYEND